MKQEKTTGYLPVNLNPQSLLDICHCKLKHYPILIFYKVIFNFYKRNGKAPIDYTLEVPLHNSLINKIFGERKAAQYLELMKSNELIEISDYHFNEAKPHLSYPRHYRIPARLLQLDLFDKKKQYKRISITDKITINAEKHYKALKLKQMVSKSKDDVLDRLSTALQAVYLDLTSKQARNLIKQNGFYKKQRGESYYSFLHRVNDRDVEWYKKDDFGRLHFPFVNLNKKAHSLIRFQGFDNYCCKEIDIVNSQAYFSSIISDNVIERMIPQSSHLVEGIDFTTLAWKEYQAICISGQFYEQWMVALSNYIGQDWQAKVAQIQKLKFEKINKKRKKQNKTVKKPKLDYATADPRDVAKALYYHVIFGTQHETDLVSNAFRHSFTELWEAFRTIKSRYCPHNPSKKNVLSKGFYYTNLAYLMQNLESRVVVQTAIKHMLDSGFTTVVPRHDSLLVPSPLIDKARVYLEDAFLDWQLPLPKISKK